MVNLLDLYYRGIYGVLSCFHFLLRFLEYSGFKECVLDFGEIHSNHDPIGTCIQLDRNSQENKHGNKRKKLFHLFYSYLSIYINYTASARDFQSSSSSHYSP